MQWRLITLFGILLPAAGLWSATAGEGSGEPAFRFVDVSESSGLAVEHGYIGGPTTDPRRIAAGVAAADVDGDGWVDLYVVTGTMGPNRLFRNRRDGTFEPVEDAGGIGLDGAYSAGPLLGDLDGDGRPDLFVGGIESEPPRVFRNIGGAFEEVTEASGIVGIGNTFSAALGDLDRDGDLDLALSHWSRGSAERERIHIWKNDGSGHFSAATDAQMGLTGYDDEDYTFTPNFADIDADGWPDLLFASDFGTSRIFRNRGDGTFENRTTDVISDKNGMGAAVGDYDNDGDLDWFVSSIGNRLYRNRGDGTFEDVTDAAGVLEGFWGWGTCFGDFNNDGFLDLFQTNGFNPDVAKIEDAPQFFDDPSRLFINQKDGTFTERSEEWGLIDRGQGRGVSCFDYDRDGDLDIFISNNSEGTRLYRNDGGNSKAFLNVRLLRPSPDVPAAGARISVTAGGLTQMREWQVGNNFVSHQPPEAHFGLGDAEIIDELRVRWPDGRIQIFSGVRANQFVVLGHGVPQIQRVGEELDFAHVPLGGGIDGRITLINPNPDRPVRGRLEFFGTNGLPRLVELEGRGSATAFDFSDEPIPPGGSRILVFTASQPLSLGWARFQTELPAEAIYRFRFGSAHIGIAPSRSMRAATIPLQNDGELSTGMAILNPDEGPLELEVSVVDAEGVVESIVQDAFAEPLAGRCQRAFFLSEVGIQETSQRSGGTVQIRTRGGGRFRVVALASGHGALSTTPVVGTAAGVFAPERFHGKYAGQWSDASGETQGDLQLVVGMVESARAATASLVFSGSTLGALSPTRTALSGEYDDGGIRLSGYSQQLGLVELTIDPETGLSLRMEAVPAAGVDTVTIIGTARADVIEATWRVEGAGGPRTGTLQLNHLNW